MLICDTSGLLAFFDARELDHEAAMKAVEADEGPFVVPPYVLAELDYLLATRVGASAELAALRELLGGAWELPCLSQTELKRAVEIVDLYSDQAIGLVDASVVVLAERYRTTRLLTLDQRHFRVLRSKGGEPFELLPA